MDERAQSSWHVQKHENDDRLSHNKRIIFVKRPGENSFPTLDCFQCEECPAPNRSDIGPGQCIVRILYLSVDAVQRYRMNKSTGVDYLSPFEIGGLVDSLEGVGVIEMVSSVSIFKVGDLVTSLARLWPWTKLFVADEMDLVKVNLPPGFFPSIVLSGVGMSGMTALLGIQKKAEIDPSQHQTFVVSGAAGSCGSLAGQIARMSGCARVIGICGSDEKCAILLDEWRFDGAINYKKESVADRLKELAPEGIDIYFDNVGGFVSDAVITLFSRLDRSLVAPSCRCFSSSSCPLVVLETNIVGCSANFYTEASKRNGSPIYKMNHGGRVILCGQIAVYNTSLPYPPPIPEEIAQIIAERDIKRERFVVLLYKNDLDATVAQLSAWLQEKKLTVRETIYKGLERAPEAFVSLMCGGNIGKMMVKVDSV